MMVTLLPAAGAGYFASLLGFGGWLAPLVLHVIWGLSLGAIYGIESNRGMESPTSRSHAKA